MTTYRINPDTITPDAAIRILDDSISEIASFISTYLRPTLSPFNPNDDRITHFSDDDTDYLPAANDLLTLLIQTRCADDCYISYTDAEPAAIRLIRAIAACDMTLLSTDERDNPLAAPCIHQTAAECDATIFRFFAPDYDDCPHTD
jgi:hypothetical protein